MKGFHRAFLALAVLAALVVLTTSKAKDHVFTVHAQDGCSVATVMGSYGVISSGFSTPSNSVKGSEVPVALVGVIAFDGVGNFSRNYTRSSGGVINQGLTTSGTYTVNSDCTGSLTFTAGAASGNTANIVIVSGGAEIFQIGTTPSITSTFDLKRQ